MKIKYNKDWEILTPNGYRDFAGVGLLPDKVTILKFTLVDGNSISVSQGHTFEINGIDEYAINLINGDCIDTVNGLKEIIKIEKLKEKQYVLDILDVKSDNNLYIANNIKIVVIPLCLSLLMITYLLSFIIFKHCF